MNWDPRKWFAGFLSRKDDKRPKPTVAGDTDADEVKFEHHVPVTPCTVIEAAHLPVNNLNFSGFKKARELELQLISMVYEIEDKATQSRPNDPEPVTFKITDYKRPPHAAPDADWLRKVERGERAATVRMGPPTECDKLRERLAAAYEEAAIPDVIRCNPALAAKFQQGNEMPTSADLAAATHHSARRYAHRVLNIGGSVAFGTAG